MLSRCQRHEFRRIPVVDIVAHLEEMAEAEGLNVDTEVLQLVARQATGSMRDAISLLDQLSALGDSISLEAAQGILGTATSQAVLDVVDALLEGDAAKGIDTMHASLDAGSDPRQFARQVVEYLRGVMLVRMGNAVQVDATVEVRQHMARHAQGFGDQNALLHVIRVFNRASTESRGAWQPSLPLELALLEAMLPPQVADVPTPTAKKTAAPASTPPPAASKPTPPPAEVTKEWGEIVQRVKAQSPNTTGLLNSRTCQHTWDNGVLNLYFGSDVLKEKMEQEKHLQALKKAAEEVFGEPVEIRCSVSGGSGGLPPGVDNTGRVAAAMRLGGEIVDINELAGKDDPDEQE